jgi:hypothetical protein
MSVLAIDLFAQLPATLRDLPFVKHPTSSSSDIPMSPPVGRNAHLVDAG